VKFEDLQIEAWTLKTMDFLAHALADYCYITKKMIFSPKKAWEVINMGNLTITPLVYYVFSIVIAVVLSACVDKEYYKPFQAVIKTIEGSKPIMDSSLWSFGSYFIGAIVIVGLVQTIYRSFTGDFCDWQVLYKACFFTSALFMPISFLEGIYSITTGLVAPLLFGPDEGLNRYVDNVDYFFRQAKYDLLYTQAAYYICLFWWGSVFYEGIMSQIIINRKTIKKCAISAVALFLVTQVFITLVLNMPEHVAIIKYRLVREARIKKENYIRKSLDESKLNEAKLGHYELFRLYSKLGSDENLSGDIRYVSQLYAICYFMHWRDFGNEINAPNLNVRNLRNKLRYALFEEAEQIIKDMVSKEKAIVDSAQVDDIQDIEELHKVKESLEFLEKQIFVQRRDRVKDISIMLEKIDALKSRQGFLIRSSYEQPFQLFPSVKYLKITP
jgi:hypothetical protein